MVDSSGTSSYTYDIQGRLKTYTPPLGLSSGYYEWYDYNNAGQKTEVKITNPNNS
jgi:YD repeat-containing protein